MNEAARATVYDQSGLGPEDFQVIELHDCFSANELLLYEALGLCGEGEAPKLIDDDDTTYGGRWVVNPSGGLISKGHPLGATGLAQCAELTWQLRGTADKRQVDNVTAALQHNIGLGGAAVVTAYQRADRSKLTMGHIEANRELSAARDAVWAMIADPSTWGEWFTVHEKWLSRVAAPP